MRMSYGVLALAVAFAMGGCTIGDGINEDADSLDWTWSIVDFGDDSIGYSCADVGADVTRLTITDDDGVVHEFMWDCEGGAGTWNADEGAGEPLIAGGDATVVADLLTYSGSLLSSGEFTFEFDGIINDLGEVEFAVDMWDPQDNPDASLWWYWQIGEECLDFDSPDDITWPTEQDCADIGIDYVTLWIWNPTIEEWWTDLAWTEFPCGAVDQDDGFYYSGLWLEDFLHAGTYQFFLGFYQEATYQEDGGDTTDLLQYYDTRGTSDDAHDGLIESDEDAGGWNDLGCTALDAGAYDLGVLKINLQWGQSGGTLFDSCFDSNVAVMGFLLRNDGWVAAEVPLSDGVECLDWLVFEEVPILVDPYELLVSGISDMDQFLWYNLCTGLDPEVGTVDDVTGYACEIENQLAQ